MATPGRETDEQTRQRIQRLREAGLSVRQVARETDTSTRTVQKYLKISLAK